MMHQNVRMKGGPANLPPQAKQQIAAQGDPVQGVPRSVPKRILSMLREKVAPKQGSGKTLLG